MTWENNVNREALEGIEELDEQLQDLEDDDDDGSYAVAPSRRLVLRRYEIGAGLGTDWPEIRMLIEDAKNGMFDFIDFIDMALSMFGYMRWFADMEEEHDAEIARTREDVHNAVLLREFADLQVDDSDQFKAARLIAEALCMQLCTNIIPPQEGNPRTTLVVLDRKGKRFELSVDLDYGEIDTSPLFSEECSL